MKLKNLTLSLALVAGTLFAMPSFAHNGVDHHHMHDHSSSKMMNKGKMMHKNMMMKKDMMMDKSGMMNKDMMMDKSGMMNKDMMMDKSYMMNKDMMMDKDMMMHMYMPDISVFGGFDHHAFKDANDMSVASNGFVLGGRLLYPVFHKDMVMFSVGGEASFTYGMGSKDMMMDKMSYTMKHNDMGYKGRVLGQAAFMMDSGDAVLVRAGLGYGYTAMTYKANDMMKQDMKLSASGPEASLYVGYQFMKKYEIGVEGYVGSTTMSYDDMPMMKKDMPMMKMMDMKDDKSTLMGITLTAAYHF